MTDPNRWYFSKEKIQNSPSRKNGIDEDKEISYRQHAANFIQDMGQRLQVTQLCINTAIVYMHRFYMFHSFTKFHRNAIAACALFLAAKVEEQPRKLEHVIKVAHWCLNQRPNKQGAQLDTKNPEYIRQANELVINENIMLQTLGFEIGIEHPHTSVVKCCQLVKASKDLAQTSYFMATSSLHLTTMCLQYKPTIVACFCIHMACKWSNWEIPVSNEGKQWFCYVDETVTLEMLDSLTSEFLFVFEKLSDRLKKKTEVKNNPLDHRPMIMPSIGSNDKNKLSQHPNADQDKRSIKPSESQSSSSNSKSMTPQPSTSKFDSRLDQQQQSSNNNNLLSNGPIKSDSIKRERINDQNIDRTSLNKQPIDKSKDMYYNQQQQFKKEQSSQIINDKKLQQQSIKPEFSSGNNNYKQTQLQSSSQSLSSINKPYDKSSHQSSSSSLSMSRSFTNSSNIDLNDKNKNNSSSTTFQKPPTKQQQIQLEKQRQQDERNRLRPKNQDYLWDNSSNKSTNNNNNNNINSNSSKANKVNNSLSSNTTASFLNNNSSSTNSSSTINHSFFDNLIHSSNIYNSNNSNSSNDNNSLSKSPKMNWDLLTGSNSNEDSFDPKKDFNSDLKMEFSDNDSNQSGVNLNLNALPSLFMNDQLMNGQLLDQIPPPPPLSTTANKPNIITNESSTSKNIFMNIFKNDQTPLSTTQMTSTTTSTSLNKNNSPRSISKDRSSKYGSSSVEDKKMPSPIKLKIKLGANDGMNGQMNDHQLTTKLQASNESSLKSSSSFMSIFNDDLSMTKSSHNSSSQRSSGKERSSKHISSDDKRMPSPIKLKIKMGANDKSDDNSNGDEKPLDSLKIVIPKNILSTSTSSKKRKKSSKDSKDKRIKMERD